MSPALATLLEQGYIVIRCNSHRARANSAGPNYAIPFYSFRRASTGGYYAIPAAQAERALKVKGVTKLRAPYDDLLQGWGA